MRMIAIGPWENPEKIANAMNRKIEELEDKGDIEIIDIELRSEIRHASSYVKYVGIVKYRKKEKKDEMTKIE